MKGCFGELRDWLVVVAIFALTVYVFNVNVAGTLRWGLALGAWALILGLVFYRILRRKAPPPPPTEPR